MTSNRFQLINPANRADYRKIVGPLADASWPEFMLHDPIPDENWSALFERFSDYQFGLFDMQSNRVAAMGNSVPLHWEGDLADLPEAGWDWAFVQAVKDHEQKIEPNIQCALQVAIHPDYQGQGLSTKMIKAMRAIGESKGFKQLIAPVRPNLKSQYPLTEIDRYITWKTDEGLPFDAWLRVHARLGAKVIKPCHEAMTIRGSRADWESWTKLSFPESGEYIVSGALNPIQMNLEKDEGVYIEPNVWMVHSLN